MLRDALLTVAALLPIAVTAAPGDTEWISIADSDGRSANAYGGPGFVSDNGRYVVFQICLYGRQQHSGQAR